MEIDYKKAVQLNLSELATKWQQDQTLPAKEVHRLLSLIEVCLEQPYVNWKRLYEVICW